MTYLSGTRTGVTNSAEDFVLNVLHDPLVAAGWTLVEAAYTGQAGYTFRVYRCTDGWHIFLGWQNNGSGIFVGSFDEWDAVNKRYSHPVTMPGGSTSTTSYSVDAAGRSNYTALTTPTSWTRQFGLGTAGFSYWFSVGANHLYLSWRVGSTDTATMVGALTAVPAHVPAGTNLFHALPHLTTPGSSLYWGVGFSREPGITAANSGNIHLNGSLTGDAPWGYGGVDAYAGTPLFGGVNVISSRYGFRGKLPHCLSSPYNNPTSAVNGDTLTVGAKTYTHWRNSTYPGVWVDQAA